MREIRRRVQKMESQTREVLSTVAELVDFVLRAQRGKVSIRDAVISKELLIVNMTEAQVWQQRAKRLAEKHNVPIEEVKRDLIARKPELAQFLL